MSPKLTPPAADEYAPFYADYIERTRETDVLALLPDQIGKLHSVLDPLSEEEACYRFGPNEWSIKEMIGHVSDVERVFSYRLLRISRNDPTPLPGFEQNDYVRESNFDDCELADLLQEFELLRRANILAIHRMTDEMIERRGTASGAAVSARGLIYMMAGHVEHHLASLHANYLPGIQSLS
jgi:DinB family protein